MRKHAMLCTAWTGGVTETCTVIPLYKEQHKHNNNNNLLYLSLSLSLSPVHTVLAVHSDLMGRVCVLFDFALSMMIRVCECYIDLSSPFLRGRCGRGTLTRLFLRSYHRPAHSVHGGTPP